MAEPRPRSRAKPFVPCAAGPPAPPAGAALRPPPPLASHARHACPAAHGGPAAAPGGRRSRSAAARTGGEAAWQRWHVAAWGAAPAFASASHAAPAAMAAARAGWMRAARPAAVEHRRRHAAGSDARTRSPRSASAARRLRPRPRRPRQEWAPQRPFPVRMVKECCVASEYVASPQSAWAAGPRRRRHRCRQAGRRVPRGNVVAPGAHVTSTPCLRVLMPGPQTLARWGHAANLGAKGYP